MSIYGILNKIRYYSRYFKYRKEWNTDIPFYLIFCERCKIAVSDYRKDDFICPVVNFEDCLKLP